MLKHTRGFVFFHRKMEKGLDDKGFGVALLMDLSKAFDT